MGGRLVPPRRGTDVGAGIRAKLLEDAKGPHLSIAEQMARVGDGGRALRELERETAALEAGEPITIAAYELSAVMFAVGVPLHEVRAVDDVGGSWIVAGDGSYSPGLT